MQHFIEGDRLIIVVDAEEQAELQELKNDDDGDSDYHNGLDGDFHSDARMYDFLEPLTANSELEWVSSFETGDLTTAPMLGIKEYHEKDLEEPKIIQRWAFMDYQVRSVLDDLLNNGKAIFIGGDD